MSKITNDGLTWLGIVFSVAAG